MQIHSIRQDPQKQLEFTAITVRPAANPRNANLDVARFFIDDAASTFLVQRLGTQVTAEVQGRNEQGKKSLITRGIYLLLLAHCWDYRKFEWKSLVKGIIKPEIRY